MSFFVLKLKAISRIFIQYVIRKSRLFKIINKMKNKLSVLLCNLFTLFLTSIIHGSLHNHDKFISQDKHICLLKRRAKIDYIYFNNVGKIYSVSSDITSGASLPYS